jgi:predicted DNA-binding transcriptional regulator AlpA
VPTIKNDLYRKPASLPPRIVMPGSKKLVWLESDVMNWLEQCRQVAKPLKASLSFDRRF